MEEAATDTVRTRFETFTCFPELPQELRLIIWDFALPNGGADDGMRTMCLKVNVESLENRRLSPFLKKPCLKVTFSVSGSLSLPTPDLLSIIDEPQRCREVRSDGRDMRNTGMLRACTESREVYLKTFPRTLPAPAGGVIRFNDQTTIQISNHIEDLPLYGGRRVATRTIDLLSAAASKGIPLPVFHSIRKLAILAPRSNSNPVGWTDTHSYLRLYSGLQELSLRYGNASKFHRHASRAISNAAYDTWLDGKLTKEVEDMERQAKICRPPEDVCPVVRVMSCRLG